MRLLSSIQDFVKANRRCKKCDVITVEADMIEVFATYIKSPSVFVADRIFIDAKYLWQSEYTAIMSSEGLENVS